jgi:hypothetical protein
MDAKATILGIPNIPTITEVNVRADASIKSEKKFTVPVGFSGMEIKQVKKDLEQAKTEGKTHYWIQIAFPGSSDGYVRDDLVAIEGDCAKFGYTDGLERTRAFDLINNSEKKSAAPAVPSVPTTQSTAPAVPAAPTTQSNAPAVSTSPETHITSAGTEQVKKFEATGKVRIRSAASLKGQHLGWLNATTEIEVESNSRTEADGYVWWKHSGGWSAEKSSNGRQVFLQPALVIGGPVPPMTSREGFDDLNRIKMASYAVTGNFEGSGYAAYNNYDAGIISYGLIQFTMAAGSFITVVQRYLANSQTDVANQLRGYLPRIEARDASLRNDVTLKNLLIAAADEQVMKDAQHSVADEKYWDKVWKGYIEPREISSPLGIALLFDSHG